MPIQLRDKSDFISKLTLITNVFKLNLSNTYSLSLQSIGASVQIQTLVHPSPKLVSSMAGQNQATQVNFIPVSFIRHYLFDFSPQISSSAFSKQELSTELLIHTEANSISYFLGPVGISDPREFIAAESQRIPFKAALSRPSLWQDAFKIWPLPPIAGWRNWYKRVLADNSSKTKTWDSLRIAQCLDLSLAETPKNEDLLIEACHFWSNGVNAFLFGHGPMSQLWPMYT
jgi:hypothetical protein